MTDVTYTIRLKLSDPKDPLFFSKKMNQPSLFAATVTTEGHERDEELKKSPAFAEGFEMGSLGDGGHIALLVSMGDGDPDHFYSDLFERLTRTILYVAAGLIEILMRDHKHHKHAECKKECILFQETVELTVKDSQIMKDPESQEIVH